MRNIIFVVVFLVGTIGSFGVMAKSMANTQGDVKSVYLALHGGN